jgi:hypothetical protein
MRPPKLAAFGASLPLSTIARAVKIEPTTKTANPARSGRRSPTI